MKEQRQFLEDAQKRLNLGPTDMARLLHANWNTYKAWLYGKNPMPGVVRVAVECLIENKRYTRGLKVVDSLNLALSDESPDSES